MKKMFDFFRYDIWRIRIRELPRKRYFLFRCLRILTLTVRGFNEDKCQLHASALTFYTLISIVPTLALGFGIAKGFGVEEMLREKLLQEVPNQEVLIRAIDFSHAYLEKTKGGLIAGIGVLVLLWSVLRVLESIEASFNDIWGIKQARSFARKFSDYLSVALVCPFMLILSSSVTIFIAANVSKAVPDVAGLSHTFSFLILKLSPYIMIWLLFSFLYLFMPNTKVRFTSALVAGIVAGTCYQFLQWIFVNGQILVAQYNAIYGSFAALPLFLLWLRFSWLIVFTGAEIAFAHQNAETYEFEPDYLQISSSFQRLLTLRIAQLLVSRFHDGEKAWSAEQISHHLEIPIRLVRSILRDLVKAEIIAEVNLGEDVIGYQPARDINALTIQDVVESLEHTGSDAVPVRESPELETLSRSLDELRKQMESLPANLPLKDV